MVADPKRGLRVQETSGRGFVLSDTTEDPAAGVVIPESALRVAIRVAVIGLVLGLLPWSISDSAAKRAKSGKVGIVFFLAEDCPRCRSVKILLYGLDKMYPIHLRTFDVDRPGDYDLFEKLEAIHSEDGFAVPLVMLGESILMGEEQITAELESVVKRLSRSGGAPFPYLGPAAKDRRVRKEPASRCPDCDRRPPTLGEEWGKIKMFVDKFF